MTMVCACSQSSLCAHHSAASAGARPCGGVALLRLRSNSAKVISPRLIAELARPCIGPRRRARGPRGAVIMSATIGHARTATLDIAYEDSGPATGVPVFLMHGWPYGPRVYDAVVPRLVEAGCRAVVPYLRGFGPTRFLAAETPRSGQQAALGDDLRQLMDALDIRQAVLVGYDWGGRAACIVAALWPARVRALVTGNGYNIQDIPNSGKPAAAEQELRQWYQYYFHLERGRAGLAANRRDIIRLLWRLWSPHWEFSEETFAQTAAAWDNPDFVDVTIQSYRHRYGNAPGDPALEPIEQALTAQP